jgi:uncharacterized membrane protein
MFCQKCGTQNGENDKFCVNCGQAINQSSTSTTQATTSNEQPITQPTSSADEIILQNMQKANAQTTTSTSTHSNTQTTAQQSIKNNIATSNQAQTTTPATNFAPTPAKPDPVERFFKWLARDWPMKVGGFFIIAALGWFVTYATMEGWLTQGMRLALGYGFALLCLFFGTIRESKNRAQGNLFLIIGAASMFASTLAGIYFEILIPALGLIIMFFVVAGVSFISLRQKNISLASSMLFFGGLMPLLFPGTIENTVLLIYLLALTLGTLWIVSLTKWRGLTAFVLGIVGFYSIGYIIDVYDTFELETLTNILIAFAFIGIFYTANITSIIKSTKTYTADIITAIGIGILFLIWMFTFATDEFEALCLFIGAILFATTSYLVYLHTQQKTPAMVYGMISGALLIIATVAQFDGQIFITAYLVETALASILILYAAKRSVSSGQWTLISFLYFPAVFTALSSVLVLLSSLVFNDYSNAMELLPELLTMFTACLTAFILAISVLQLTDSRVRTNLTFFRLFAAIGSFYGLTAIWITTHLFIDDYDIATFISLFSYTMLGVLFYILGSKNNYRPHKVVGGILLAVVIIRVLLIEFWVMEIGVKIITLFALGVLLISTVFIGRIKK